MNSFEAMSQFHSIGPPQLALVVYHRTLTKAESGFLPFLVLVSDRFVRIIFIAADGGRLRRFRHCFSIILSPRPIPTLPPLSLRPYGSYRSYSAAILPSALVDCRISSIIPRSTSSLAYFTMIFIFCRSFADISSSRWLPTPPLHSLHRRGQ